LVDDVMEAVPEEAAAGEADGIHEQEKDDLHLEEQDLDLEEELGDEIASAGAVSEMTARPSLVKRLWPWSHPARQLDAG
jgi:hypothetical protein